MWLTVPALAQQDSSRGWKGRRKGQRSAPFSPGCRPRALYLDLRGPIFNFMFHGSLAEGVSSLRKGSLTDLWML